jgi:hypothetical protein
MALLPGEDRAAFEELHRALVAEYSPVGVSEEDVVWTMTHIIWRKNHMRTVRAAKRAWDLYRRIESRHRAEMAEKMRMSSQGFSDEFPPKAREKLREAVEKEARQELGDDYKFIEAGEDGIIEQFEVISRLDSMLDVCVKRLLLIRGWKSVSSSTSSARLLPRPDGDKAA